MKKFFVLFTSAAMLSLVACGPSEAEKKAAHDKHVLDSTRTADSLEAEAIKMEMMITPPATNDTIVIVDSLNMPK